jgi:hypothetical protein
VIRVERAIDVERSASEVFERLTRIEDLPHWEPAIVEAALESPPPAGVGSRVRIVVDVAGTRTTATGTVTEFERPRRIAIVAHAGGAELEGDVSITPRGAAASTVALATSIKLGGLLRFVEGAVRSRIEAGAPEMAASVKAWLERDEPPAPGPGGSTAEPTTGG